MKVRYEAGSAAVSVNAVGRVERGQTVEVDSAVGRQLIAQGWQEVKSLPVKAPKPDTNKEND